MVLALGAIMNFALGLWLGLGLGVFLGMLLFALFELAKRGESHDVDKLAATRKFFRRAKKGSHVSTPSSIDRAPRRDQEHAKDHR